MRSTVLLSLVVTLLVAACHSQCTEQCALDALDAASSQLFATGNITAALTHDNEAFVLDYSEFISAWNALEHAEYAPLLRNYALVPLKRVSTETLERIIAEDNVMAERFCNELEQLQRDSRALCGHYMRVARGACEPCKQHASINWRTIHIASCITALRSTQLVYAAQLEIVPPAIAEAVAAAVALTRE
jgi:hypothetical protein